MSAILACLLLVVAMTAVVVFTMAVENWSHIVQLLPAPAPEGDPAAADTPAATPSTVAATAATDPGDPLNHSATLLAVLPSATPEAGRPAGAVTAAADTVQIRDRDTADTLAALLFAAYAASRRAGADRASAWVTAAATPPSLERSRITAGMPLRGKPARVAELLRAHDDDATWLTLQRSVDIAKGVARTPVKQPTLAALLGWWEHTRSLPTVIRPTEAGRMADAVSAVRPLLDDTPWAGAVEQVHEALRTAAVDRRPLLVGLDRPEPAGTPAAATVRDVQPRPAAVPVAPGGTSGGSAGS
jgi:hypothetical protein